MVYGGDVFIVMVNEMELKPIRLAATLVVCRDSERGLEVYLLKRSSRAQFMANVMVYPGGGLEPQDEVLSSEVGGTRGLWSAAPMRALALAALRETFEESGLLCAHFASSPALETLRSVRHQVLEGTTTFAEVLASLEATLSLDSLWYFARWVTPNWETKRYDTYFFITRAPEAQEARSDERETERGAWYTPADAIAAYDRGELILSPPTWATLRDLCGCSCVDEALAFGRSELPSPILPHFTDIGEGEKAVLLPGDALYPENHDPQVDTTPRVVPRRTRIAFTQGRWRDA